MAAIAAFLLLVSGCALAVRQQLAGVTVADRPLWFGVAAVGALFLLAAASRWERRERNRTVESQRAEGTAWLWAPFEAEQPVPEAVPQRAPSRRPRRTTGNGAHARPGRVVIS